MSEIICVCVCRRLGDGEQVGPEATTETEHGWVRHPTPVDSVTCNVACPSESNSISYDPIETDTGAVCWRRAAEAQ